MTLPNGGGSQRYWRFRASPPHLGSKLRLEADLAIFGRPWKGQDGAKMGPKGAKRSQVEAKLAGSCGQEAPRNTQEGHFGVKLRASWPIWKAFWRHLEQKAGKQKAFKTLKFFIGFLIKQQQKNSKRKNRNKKRIKMTGQNLS